ncbi:Mitogen-activated protein kinase kinase kinase 5 [Linum grandiflorum]
MRWPSLSFSLHSFSPRSSASVTSPKPSSSCSAADDASPALHNKPNNHHNRNNNNNHGPPPTLAPSHTFGFRLRSSSTGIPKLTRQKKLRHLTDSDVFSDEISDEPTLSRSKSACSSPIRSATAPLPVPLPLPQPSNPAEADSRLRSPREKDRDGSREKSNGDAIGTSLCTSAHSSVLGGRTEQHQEITRSDRALALDLNNFGLNNGVRNYSNSPYASPEISPQRLMYVFATSPYQSQIPNGIQAWSAPEMPTLDIPGLPPPAFFDFTAHTSDSSSSPLHNPMANRSPPSPVTARTSFEILPPARRDNNSSGNVEVHKLPLPPGANLISPTSLSTPPLIPPVVAAKQEPVSVPMKSQWQKGKLIGRGTFGSVYVATNRETGALCAMKEVDMFPDDPKCLECIKQLEQEIKVLSKLKHPNIVQYYGSEIIEDQFYIYLEYVHPGSINKYVREHCGAVTESIVRSFTRHILSGLAYLHTMKTVHRDIKGANLLVDASGVVKLADFGTSKHVSTACSLSVSFFHHMAKNHVLDDLFLDQLTGQAAELSLKGSPYWMAPELMQAVMQKDNNSDLALAVDIWSLGCTIIEMITGKPPWSEYEGAAAMFRVMKDTPPVPETLSPDGKDFLFWCFKRNPAERPSASLLLEHRWLKQLPDATAAAAPPSPTPQINGTKPMDKSRSIRVSDDINRTDPLAQLQTSRSSKGKLAAQDNSAAMLNYVYSPARPSNDLMKLPT